jgi:hypothetical protein
LLIYVAINALGLHSDNWTLLPRPLIFALMMLAWGGSALRRNLPLLSSAGSKESGKATTRRATTKSSSTSGRRQPASR